MAPLEKSTEFTFVSFVSLELQYLSVENPPSPFKCKLLYINKSSSVVGKYQSKYPFFNGFEKELYINLKASLDHSINWTN